MRKIEYIFIDSDREALVSKSDRYDVSNLRYHYVVNSQGLVINPTPYNSHPSSLMVPSTTLTSTTSALSSYATAGTSCQTTSWDSEPPFSTSSLNFASTSPMPRYLVYQKSMARNFTAATSSSAMP